jgi:hypothetical protein
LRHSSTVSPNRAATCISPRTLKVRAVISATLLDIHRAYVPGFDPAFAIGDAEEPLLTPCCVPTILAYPAPIGVVVTHYGYAMAAYLGIADMLIIPPLYEKKSSNTAKQPMIAPLEDIACFIPFGSSVSLVKPLIRVKRLSESGHKLHGWSPGVYLKHSSSTMPFETQNGRALSGHHPVPQEAPSG